MRAAKHGHFHRSRKEKKCRGREGEKERKDLLPLFSLPTALFIHSFTFYCLLFCSALHKPAAETHGEGCEGAGGGVRRGTAQGQAGGAFCPLVCSPHVLLCLL